MEVTADVFQGLFDSGSVRPINSLRERPNADCPNNLRCLRAPDILDKGIDLADIAFRMAPFCAQDCPGGYGIGEISSSFMALMAAAHKNSSLLPEAFLFTMNSTIPVADATRGFYKESGLAEPLLLPVRDKNIGTDILDINPYIIKGKRVVLVDEYYFDGKSVGRAQERIFNVGRAAAIMCVSNRTEWYEQAEHIGDYNSRTNPNLMNMTSPYADFMHDLGRKAARFLSEPKNREWIEQYISDYKWVSRSDQPSSR